MTPSRAIISAGPSAIAISALIALPQLADSNLCTCGVARKNFRISFRDGDLCLFEESVTNEVAPVDFDNTFGFTLGPRDHAYSVTQFMDGETANALLTEGKSVEPRGPSSLCSLPLAMVVARHQPYVTDRFQ